MSKALSVQNALNSALFGYKDRAVAVKAAHKPARQAIINDPKLSNIGRREKLDALNAQTRSQLDAIKEEQMAFEKGLRDKAESDLRGYQSKDTSDVLLRRDAADRARKIIDQQEALDVLKDAIANGDDGLAHAVGSRARFAGMTGVAEAYQNAFPSTADAAEALAYVEANTSGAAWNLSNQITYSAPSE